MTKINSMVSMALTDEESYDAPMPIKMDDKPTFPYGLCICLTDAELVKLGLDPAEAMDGIGGLVLVHGLARITSASINQREGDEPSARVELQFEDLAIESDGDAADAPKPRRSMASIYKT